MWTHFWDMHSGGGQKLQWAHIFIEAPEDEAKLVFFKRFGRNPEKVTCTCCGPDYSISSNEELSQLTGFHRGCESVYVVDGQEMDENWWYSLPREERGAANACFRYVERQATSRIRIYTQLEHYMKQDDVTFIPASHIEPSERVGRIPQQGYVWVDGD